MANELSNAVVLMKNEKFRDWIMAASVYQARVVITEGAAVTDHALRVQLAQTVVVNPDMHLAKFVNALACDPDIAGAGTDIEVFGQGPLLSKLAGIWTPMAKMIFNQ